MYNNISGVIMKDLEKRVEKLEALVAKLLHAKVPNTPMVKSVDIFASRIQTAINTIEHVMLNRDLLRTEDVITVMASISAERAFSGFDAYNEVEMRRQAKIIAAKMKLIPEVISMVMTSYYNNEDDDDIPRGSRRFNKSVWVIRNHDKYKEMTVTQRYNEYKAQRTRVNVEYHNRCKELGWVKDDHPDYPWFFPTNHGPADKPSFL